MFLGGVAQAGMWFQIYFGVTRHSETIETETLSDSSRPGRRVRTDAWKLIAVRCHEIA
jgi:hypothetical protein